MAEVMYVTRGPAPVPYDNRKLTIRPGSPAHQMPTVQSQKVEIKGIAREHTMGKRTNTVPGAVHGAGGPPPIARTAKVPAKQASVPTRPIAQPKAAAPVKPLLSPEAAVFVGQLLEMFLFSELQGPRADGPYVALATDTLARLHPLFPIGVTIPVPTIEQTSIPMPPLSPSPAPPPTEGAAK